MGNTTQEGFGIDDILIAESNDIAVLELFYPDSLCGDIEFNRSGFNLQYKCRA